MGTYWRQIGNGDQYCVLLRPFQARNATPYFDGAEFSGGMSRNVVEIAVI